VAPEFVIDMVSLGNSVDPYDALSVMATTVRALGSHAAAPMSVGPGVGVAFGSTVAFGSITAVVGIIEGSGVELADAVGMAEGVSLDEHLLRLVKIQMASAIATTVAMKRLRRTFLEGPRRAGW
jgi:hypothetical protein